MSGGGSFSSGHGRSVSGTSDAGGRIVRGLLAVLAVTPESLLRAGERVTEAEALAFVAGQRAALDAVHTALARAWGADRPVGRGGLADTGDDRAANAGRGGDRSGPVGVRVDDKAWAVVTRVRERHFPFLDGPRVPGAPVAAGVAAACAGGRLVVVDGDGVVVAEFDGAAWETAHAWVHARVAEPLTRRPVCIEDHRNRQTWQIDVDSCTRTLWTPEWRSDGASACPLIAPMDR
ncbi:hypothetical protein [Protofrankia symbiont of Coriaria ruscifolia]|uniref:hypothetical protein n=1 Tax=Protofrankia symbiont of Coriaria ruscifolia TaxID=1306542 RepID=UPI001041065B|nr:hypothetical protein [Protofrankia symbiont of Coriaria ruscifolia]